MLLPGVAVLDVEQADGSRCQTWRYPDGLAGYLAELAAGRTVAPLRRRDNMPAATDKSFAEGEGAFGRSAGSPKFVPSESVNLIPTVAGGSMNPDCAAACSRR